MTTFDDDDDDDDDDDTDNRLAGLPPPHQKVKQWQDWEDMLIQKGEQVYWNPIELTLD